MVYQKNINSKSSTESSIYRMFVLAAIFICCLLWGGTMARAADYTIFGQVFKVGSEQAADDVIALADLDREKCPFVKIMIYNRATSELLGEGYAGINGEYTIQFTNPAVGPDVECRVYKVMDDGSELYEEARPQANWIDAIATFNQKALLVISDEISDYDDEEFSGHPGVGMVFTRVGEVPTQYIPQAAASPIQGMADVPGGAPAYVPAFQQSPFGSRLKIFGDFGRPSVVCPYNTYEDIDWYRITIENTATTQTFTWKELLSKLKTVIVYSWPLSITNDTEKIGPFDGEDAVTPAITHDGLYKVTRNNTADVFYAFPDLRVWWNTSGLNGLYKLSVEYFKEVPGGTPTNPRVFKLDNTTCFSGAPPATLANNYAVEELYVLVNNGSLDVDFLNIYLKTGGGTYYGGATPVDFNDPANKCSIIDLDGQYGIEIVFKARHNGLYMKNWGLSATPNQGPGVTFGSDTFTAHPAANGQWEGTASTTLYKAYGEWDTCAYIFDLTGWSRVQDGYHYIQKSHPRRTYYVQQ